MKGPAVIGCLLLGLCCPALFAQKTLLTDASTGAPSIASPHLASHVHRMFSSSVRNASVPVEVQVMPVLFASLGTFPAMNDEQAYLAGAVCSEAFPAAEMSRPSDYAFGRLQFNRAAIEGTFNHDHLVKMVKNFVPGQPLPDAPYYVPLTAQQKFDGFLRSLHTPGFSVGILADSVISEATGAYPTVGGGISGYGQRLGLAAAGETSAAFFSGFVFPTLLHQDPRYFRSHQDAIADRLAYAASRVLIGRSDSGHNVINFSAILSQFAQAAVSNAYVPYRNETVSGTLENAVAGLGAVAQANILNEFWPDIKEFFSRHNPESLEGQGSTRRVRSGKQLAVSN